MSKRLKITDYDRVFKRKCVQLLETSQTAMEEKRPELSRVICTEILGLCKQSGEDDQPSIQVLVLNKLSIAERYLQRHDSGLSHLDRALELCQRYKLEMGETLVNYSAILMDLKNFAEAEKYATKAIRTISADLLASNSKQDHKLSAIAYYNCGKCQKYLGNVHEAAANYQAALAILKKAGMSTEDPMYKRICLEHLNFSKALNSKKADSKFVSSATVKKTFLSVKMSKDKPPKQFEDKEAPTKNIFGYMDYAKTVSTKMQSPVKERVIFSASVVRMRNPKLRRNSFSKSQQAANDGWEEANMKFRINNGSSVVTHRSNKMKRKEQDKSTYLASPSDLNHKKADNESWDENTKDVIAIKSKSKPLLSRITNIDAAMARNKNILVKDLKLLNNQIVWPGKKHFSLHRRKDSESRHTEEVQRTDKHSQISSQSSAVNERQTTNSDVHRDLVNFRNSSTRFFIKQSEKSSKKPTHDGENPEIFESINVFERPATPLRIQKTRKMANMRNCHDVIVHGPERTAPKKKVPTKALQEYSCRKIQRYWRSRKYADTVLKKDVSRDFRSARFLCNMYVLLWSNGIGSAPGKKHPCKIMVYLHKECYLLTVFVLPSMEGRYLRVPKKINVLARDFSRVRLTAMPDLNPYLTAEEYKPPSAAKEPAKKLASEDKPVISSLLNEAKPTLDDSLEKIKEEIINGLLEEDNESSKKELDHTAFNKAVAKTSSTPVIKPPTKGHQIYFSSKKNSNLKVSKKPEKISALHDSQIKEKSAESSKVALSVAKVDEAVQTDETPVVEVVVYQVHTVAAAGLEKIVETAHKTCPPKIPATKYPVTKRYGNLNGSKDEELKKARQLACLFIKDYLKGRVAVQRRRKTRKLLLCKKHRYHQQEFLMSVFLLLELNRLQVIASPITKKAKPSVLTLLEDDTQAWVANSEQLLNRLTVVGGQLQWTVEEEEAPMPSDDLENSKSILEEDDFDPMIEESLERSDFKRTKSMFAEEDREAVLDGKREDVLEVSHFGATAKNKEAEPVDNPVVEVPKPHRGREEFTFELRTGDARTCTIVVKELEDKSRVVEYYSTDDEFLGFDPVGDMTRDWIVRLLVWKKDAAKPSISQRPASEEVNKPQFWALASNHGIF